MDRERYARVKQLYLDVCELDAEARTARLETECGPETRDEVESLLAHRTVDASAPPLAKPIRAGEVIAGRFRIRGELGSGASGEVFHADDLELGAEVALKIFHSASGSDGQVERLRSEVRLAREVTHPSVCRVFDLGEYEDRFFLTMEYLDGRDLRVLLRQVGRLPSDRVREIGLELCEALAAAHAGGVLHRDLKPANVLIDADGRPKIADFGIAVSLHGGAPDAARAGTPSYMAPEQILPLGGISERTDLYALGAVLYELVTGHPPLEATSFEELAGRHLETHPSRPGERVADVDPHLDAAIMQALAKNPEDRPASASAFAALLRGGQADGASAATARQPELRSLTLVCAELSVTRAAGAPADPEAQRDAIRSWREHAAEVVDANAGAAARELGDRVLFLFGYPRAQDDDAERALRAACTLASGGSAVDERVRAHTGCEIEVRLGVHTSEVVVERHSGGSIDVVGDAMRLVDQLAHLAPPSTVVASDATLRLVGGLFLTKDLGWSAQSGAESVAAHAVLRTSGVRERVDAAADRLSPFVGRQRELESLIDLWERVEDELSGHAVLISGEAGVGKTRLLRRLQERLADRPHTLLEARCRPEAVDMAFRPVVEVLRTGLGLATSAPRAEQRERIARELAAVGFDSNEDAPLIEAVLGLREDSEGPNLPAGRDRERTIELLGDWVLALAREQPVLFVIENLQWCDPSTLEALDQLIHQIPTAQVLLVATHRTDFVPPWLARSHITSTPLGRLARRDAEEMVRRVGATLSAPQREQVIERADGVPLFIEELAKAVALDGEGGPVPATLHSTLTARLDATGTAKETAQLAATIGREFEYPVLAEVSALDENELRAALARLEEAELVYARGTPPAARYVFKHRLIQEAAYGSLLRANRRDHHERIAGCLMERFPELASDRPDLLARHLMESERWLEAADAWSAAATHAAGASGFVEAGRLLARALDALARAPQSPDRDASELATLALRATIQVATEGYGSVGVSESLRQARRVIDADGSGESAAVVLLTGYGYHLVRAEHDESASYVDELARLGDARQEVRLGRQAKYARLSLAVYAGQLAEAEAELSELTTRHTAHESFMPMAFSSIDAVGVALADASLAHSLRGRPERARRELAAVLGVADERGDAHLKAFTLCLSAFLANLETRYADARRDAEAALALAEHESFAMFARNAELQILVARSAAGDTSTGAPQLRDALAAFLATGTRVTVATLMARAADGLLRCSDTAAARAMIDEAFAHLGRGTERFSLSDLHRARGEILACDGAPLEHVLADFDRAIAVARDQGAVLFEVRAATERARAYAAHGRPGEGRDALAAAIARFAEADASPVLRDARDLVASLPG